MTKPSIAFTVAIGVALLAAGFTFSSTITPISSANAQAEANANIRPPCTPRPDPSQLVPGRNCRNVVVDGFVREFLVYVPEDLTPGEPVPIVFAYHYGTGSMELFSAMSGFRAIGQREGFIVVFPQALQYYSAQEGVWTARWNTYGLEQRTDLARLPGYPDASPWPADDVAFTLAMIEQIQTQWAIDDRRIYAAGFSNGAALATRLAHEIPNVIAAVSASSAGFSGGLSSASDLSPAARSVPILLMVGARDRFLTAANDGAAFPLDPAALLEPSNPFDTLTEAFGYSSLPCATELSAEGALLRMDFCDTDAADGVGEMVFVLLAGIGHSYPSPVNNSAGLNAAEFAWAFFRDNPRAELSTLRSLKQ